MLSLLYVINLRKISIHYLRKNICGGPSIVMSRHQERDVTKIRNDKTTKKVVGYDANGLYAWTMLQDMPTGHFRVRRKENNFQLDAPPRWLGAREWLDWSAHEMTCGHILQHGPSMVILNNKMFLVII